MPNFSLRWRCFGSLCMCGDLCSTYNWHPSWASRYRSHYRVSFRYKLIFSCGAVRFMTWWCCTDRHFDSSPTPATSCHRQGEALTGAFSGQCGILRSPLGSSSIHPTPSFCSGFMREKEASWFCFYSTATALVLCSVDVFQFRNKYN